MKCLDFLITTKSLNFLLCLAKCLNFLFAVKNLNFLFFVAKCPAGQFSYNGYAPNCRPCPQNYYQSNTGSTVCTRCNVDKITLSTGSDDVTDCVDACKLSSTITVIKEAGLSCFRFFVRFSESSGFIHLNALKKFARWPPFFFL